MFTSSPTSSMLYLTKLKKLKAKKLRTQKKLKLLNLIWTLSA